MKMVSYIAALIRYITYLFSIKKITLSKHILHSHLHCKMEINLARNTANRGILVVLEMVWAHICDKDHLAGFHSKER